MREALMRFTRSPLSGVMTGAASTAILQSSSATTVAAVGFVGAGLMGFSESLGIIFGANLGTTITGWLVVLLGFKLQLGTLILPLILIGAILKLFAKERIRMIGFSLAGFGLIFVGISMMQQGMGGLEELVTPAQFPSDTWFGRLKLVALGILITLITQSSSAGVAAALTALYAGAINFNQAAALVIGMDVGTTVTAAMATIGAGLGSRRTGLSHVIYNILTAVVALIILTPYTLSWELLAPGQLTINAEVALVGFHSLFNMLGVVLVLPFTEQFAKLITKIVRAPSSSYTEQLDPTLLASPAVALRTVLTTTKTELIDLLCHIKNLLSKEPRKHAIDMVKMQVALDETHAYVDLIHLKRSSRPEWNSLLGIIHVLDHMQRLHERCDEEPYRAKVALELAELQNTLRQVIASIDYIIEKVEKEQWAKAFKATNEMRKSLAKQLAPIRGNIMTNVALGKITVPQATDHVEALRWLQRVFNHITRITFHLQS